MVLIDPRKCHCMSDGPKKSITHPSVFICGCPETNLCGWQDVKIHLLLILLFILWLADVELFVVCI